jgi:hypothetical protein
MPPNYERILTPPDEMVMLKWIGEFPHLDQQAGYFEG